MNVAPCYLSAYKVSFSHCIYHKTQSHLLLVGVEYLLQYKVYSNNRAMMAIGG